MKFDKSKVFAISGIIAIIIAGISVVLTGMDFLQKGGFLIITLGFLTINEQYIEKKMQTKMKKTYKKIAIIFSIIFCFPIFFVKNAWIIQISAIIVAFLYLTYVNDIRKILKKSI